MGLDMYVYRIGKISEEEKEDIEKSSYEELCKSGYTLYEWTPDAESLLSQIMDFLVFVKKPVERIHFDVAKKVCGIPEDADFCGQCGCVYLFTNHDGKPLLELDYSKCTEEQKRQMTLTDIVTYAVFRKEDEVWYWKNNDELQEKLYEDCDVQIQNCGYYPLNDKMREAIKEDLEKSGVEYNPDVFASNEYSIVCYHEWY